MAIQDNEDQVKFLKNLFFTDEKLERCNDTTISFYQALDKPYTWNIFNAKSFLSTIERRSWNSIPETENHINMFLYHILRTLNVMVFGAYKDSIFTQKLSNHLNTFIDLVYISDVSVRATETLKLLCSKCNENYSKVRQHTLLTDIYLKNNYGDPKEHIVIQLTLTDKHTGVITVLTFNLYL